MQLESFTTLNIAILVLALGKWLNNKIAFLREFNIPEPVTSGLLVCVLTAILYITTGAEILFHLATRDFLLLYFFAGIGLNSDFASLKVGGRPLAILVVLTVVYMFIQNFTGIAVASVMGLDRLVGVIGGTVALIGGHGTTIAWAPIFTENHGITNASEIGIACATLGLVLSSVMGGPIARILITRNKLESAERAQPDVGILQYVDPGCARDGAARRFVDRRHAPPRSKSPMISRTSPRRASRCCRSSSARVELFQDSRRGKGGYRCRSRFDGVHGGGRLRVLLAARVFDDGGRLCCHRAHAYCRLNFLTRRLPS